MLVHADTPKIDAFVREEFLYNLSPDRVGALVPVTIFGFLSYAGEHPATSVLIKKTKGIFSNIPLNALVASNATPLGPIQELSTVCPINSPSFEFTLIQYEYLRSNPRCSIFRDNQQELGVYWFTVDWYKDNQQYHFIELDNGQFILWPQHKVLWDTRVGIELPKYQKMRSVWRI